MHARGPGITVLSRPPPRSAPADASVEGRLMAHSATLFGPRCMAGGAPGRTGAAAWHRRGGLAQDKWLGTGPAAWHRARRLRHRARGLPLRGGEGRHPRRGGGTLGERGGAVRARTRWGPPVLAALAV